MFNREDAMFCSFLILLTAHCASYFSVMNTTYLHDPADISGSHGYEMEEKVKQVHGDGSQ